jgi:hypothetical protein
MEVQVSDRRVLPGVPVVRPGENGRAVGPAQGPRGDGESINLQEVLRVLRRHLLLVSAFALAFAGISAWIALRTPPTYESTATVRLGDLRSGLTGGLGDPVAERMAGRRDPLLSQMEVMRSRTLVGNVVDRQGLRLRPVGTDLPAGLIRAAQVPAATPDGDTIDLTFHAGQVEARLEGQRAAAAYGAPLTLGALTFTVDRLAARGRHQRAAGPAAVAPARRDGPVRPRLRLRRPGHGAPGAGRRRGRVPVPERPAGAAAVAQAPRVHRGAAEQQRPRAGGGAACPERVPPRAAGVQLA